MLLLPELGKVRIWLGWFGVEGESGLGEESVDQVGLVLDVATRPAGGVTVAIDLTGGALGQLVAEPAVGGSVPAGWSQSSGGPALPGECHHVAIRGQAVRHIVTPVARS